MGVFNLIISLKANSQTSSRPSTNNGITESAQCTHADGNSPAIDWDELSASSKLVEHISVNVKYINFARSTFEFDFPRKGWAKTMRIKFSSLVAWVSIYFLYKWHFCSLSNEQKKNSCSHRSNIVAHNEKGSLKHACVKRLPASTQQTTNIDFHKIETQPDGLNHWIAHSSHSLIRTRAFNV